MARINNKTLSWNAGVAADIVAHRVYVSTSGVDPNYGSQFTDVPMPTVSMVLPDEFAGFPLIDGLYKLGISSVDDMGNESDITVISNPLDFIAPDAPTNLAVI